MCDTYEHIRIGETAARFIPGMLNNLTQQDGAGAGYDDFINTVVPWLARKGTNGRDAQTGRPSFLKLAAGPWVSYGDILAISGDFYITFDGTVDSALGIGADTFELEAGSDPDDLGDKNAILNGILDAYHYLLDYNPDVYKQWGAKGNEWMKKAARPGSGKLSSVGDTGRVLALALSNSTHFGFDAISQYIRYHQAAINEAIAGRNASDVGIYLNSYPADPTLTSSDGLNWTQDNPNFCMMNGLIRALKINAFADHYLSDLFSSGHMRVPRQTITDHFGRWYIPKAGQLAADGRDIDLASIISGIGHDEDGNWGLMCRLALGYCTLNGIDGAITGSEGIYGEDLKANGQVPDLFYARGDNHFDDNTDNAAQCRGLAYYAVGLSIRDILFASVFGQQPPVGDTNGYLSPLQTSIVCQFPALRLAPWPHPPDNNWVADWDSRSTSSWNYYPLCMPWGTLDGLQERWNRFNQHLQTNDQSDVDGLQFRKTSNWGSWITPASNSYGCALDPTASWEYFDMESCFQKGEWGLGSWAGDKWRAQESARLIERYVHYKMKGD